MMNPSVLPLSTQVPLTDATFKEATWDYVQNTVTATDKWGDIGAWDVSDIKDFSFAFSKHRNNAGGSYASANFNNKVADFVGTGMSKWITTSVTSLDSTFYGSSAMNADLSKWSVAKVATMKKTFYRAGGINADLSKWSVAMVTTMEGTFHYASKFTGAGLDLWDVSKVTNMGSTFDSATSLTACSKRKIADAWKGNSVFVATTYDTDWAGATCPVRLE